MNTSIRRTSAVAQLNSTCNDTNGLSTVSPMPFPYKAKTSSRPSRGSLHTRRQYTFTSSGVVGPWKKKEKQSVSHVIHVIIQHTGELCHVVKRQRYRAQVLVHLKKTKKIDRNNAKSKRKHHINATVITAHALLPEYAMCATYSSLLGEYTPSRSPSLSREISDISGYMQGFIAHVSA